MKKAKMKTHKGGEIVYWTDPSMNVKMQGTVRYQDGVNYMVDFPGGSATQWILDNCPDDMPELEEAKTQGKP